MHCSAKKPRYHVDSDIPDDDISDQNCTGDADANGYGYDDGIEVHPVERNLLKLLRSIQKKSSLEFAVSGLTPIPLPGITINNYGTIGLPVNKTNVQDLKKHFQKVPDSNSWQLDPKKFEIKNPQFNSGVDKLVQEVKNGLGCHEFNVTSHLKKLWLFEPGSHFKPHTVKHPGMFATLIIQVPSVFTGGDLVVKNHSKEKRVMLSSDEAAFQCFYSAYYTDCQHELTEITSGCRMALVYSLCCDDNNGIPSPPDVPTNKLADLLKQIDQEVLPFPSMVAWALDHQYFKTNILERGAQALKGSDKLIYCTLQEANNLLSEDKKIEFFLVEAVKTDSFYRGKPDAYRCRYGHCKTDHKFNLIDIDGHNWSDLVDFHLDVSEDVLNFGKSADRFWGKNSEGECDCLSEKQCVSKSYWQRFVLIMLPKVNATKLFYKKSVETAVMYLQGELQKRGAECMKNLADDIVHYCIANKSTFCENEENAAKLLTILMEMKELELTRKLLAMLSEPSVIKSPEQKHLKKRYPWSLEQRAVGYGFPSKEMVSTVSDIIKTFTWQAVSEAVTNLVASSPPIHNKFVVTFLNECPDTVPKDRLLSDVIAKAMEMIDEEECVPMTCEQLKAGTMKKCLLFVD